MIEQTRRLGPFTERNGVNALAEVQAMIAGPEIQLGDVEKVEAITFAHGLFNGSVTLADGRVLTTNDNPDRVKTLKQINDSKVEAQAKTFYLGAFATVEGCQALAKMGLARDETAEVVKRLADVETITAKISPQLRREAADATHTWYVENLAERLVQSKEGDINYTGDESITINYDPNKLLTKIEDLQAYRCFYREIYKAGVTRAGKEDAGRPLKETMQTLLDIHMAKVNSQLAVLYPYAMNLAKQLALAPPTQKSETWRQRLYTALPIIRLVFAHLNGYEAATADMPRFSRRLDLLRNGAARRGGPSFSPISEAVEYLAETYEPEETSTTVIALPKGSIERLKSTKITSNHLKSLLEAVLDKHGLLSALQATKDEVDKRDGSAADGKWQVIIVPNSSKLDVAESKKIMNVGESQIRSMLDGLATSAHELTHVWQAEYGEKLESILPLASIRGRRALTTWEMGGILEERRTKNRLGISRPTNFTYLRSLEAKLANSNRLQAARASYESAIAGKDLTEDELAQEQQKAADRIERLYRHNGYNSQPLDYSEQELLLRALEDLPDDQRRAVAIAGGSFAFADAARLCKLGLLELPVDLKVDPTGDVLEIFKTCFQEVWLGDAKE